MTYKAQLSLGLHVLVMMFTFYAAGHVGTSYVSADPVHVSSWSGCGCVPACSSIMPALHACSLASGYEAAWWYR